SSRTPRVRFPRKCSPVKRTSPRSELPRELTPGVSVGCVLRRHLLVAGGRFSAFRPSLSSVRLRSAHKAVAQLAEHDAHLSRVLFKPGIGGGAALRRCRPAGRRAPRVRAPRREHFDAPRSYLRWRTLGSAPTPVRPALRAPLP